MLSNLSDELHDLSVMAVFSGLFSYVMSLCHHQVRRQYSVSAVSSEIDIILYDVKRIVNEQREEESALEMALFAICAWTDETILNMSAEDSSGLSSEWKNYLLQTRYFNTLNAGYEFFEKLNSLEVVIDCSAKANIAGFIGSQHDSVREIYFFCLALGYRGRYIDVNDEALLDGLKQANYLYLKHNNLLKLRKNKLDNSDVVQDVSIDMMELNNGFFRNNTELVIKKYSTVVILASSGFVYLLYCVFSLILDIRFNNVMQDIGL